MTTTSLLAAKVRRTLEPGGVISRQLPGYESRPSQVEMAELVAAALDSGQHAIVEAGTGVGKALDVDTPIATPTGWTRMGDLRAGDIVFDETGMPTEVLSAFDVMYDRPCYQIEFSDGSTLVADEEHEWITHTWLHRHRASRRRRAAPSRNNFATGDTVTRLRALLATVGSSGTISAAEVVSLIGGHKHTVWRATQGLTPVEYPGGRLRLYERQTLLAAVLARIEQTISDRHIGAEPYSRLTTREIASSLAVTYKGIARLNHAIPVAQPLTLPDADLPIDPFVLGVWLGDGAANASQVTTADLDTIHAIERAGYLVKKLRSKYLYSLHLSSGAARSRWEPSLIGLLRSLDVLKDKHIPLCYLRASERQRRALLAGLLDTDGTVTAHGSIQYTSTNARLAQDVQALVSSLGYRPTVMTKPARLYGKDCGVSHTINFRTTDPVFRLPRKSAAHKERLRTYTPARNGYRYITNVRPVPSRPVRCIQVAAASHLYLAGTSLIPTHNSLAYLIPAVYSGKRIIVSTANKALQDQLISKDIPFLQQTLPRRFTSALVKGRNNYLCLDRLDDEDHFQAMDGRNLDYRRLKEWAASTRWGDFEEMPVALPRDLISRVASTTRTCVGNACAYYHTTCFVERVRALAEASQIVVCNHALLLADLVVRDMGAYLLPEREAVIVDEAHRLEEAAVSAFTVAVNRRELMDLTESALLRRHAEGRTLAALPGLIDAFLRPLEARMGLGPSWRGDAGGSTQAVTEQLDAGLELSQALDALSQQLRSNDPYRNARGSKEARHYEKLVGWVSQLAEDTRLVSVVSDRDSVRYLERTTLSRQPMVTLKWTPIDVSKPLEEMLFRHTPVVCTSATLAVGTFDFFRQAVGIGDALEMVAPSPFDYPSQCLLYVAAHLPEFSRSATPEYVSALAAEMERLVRASRGRAFLLFTSYRTLNDVHAALCDRLPFTVLKQGEAPRAELLRCFRQDGAAVLFGTKSFWEGVDVVGEALSLVAIDRMPFSVPDDPVVAARVDKMKQEGGDWFNDLMLPAAVLQLKQGFGRLIRSRSDRGVVAILDSRLVRKSYGRTVIRALPPARVAWQPEAVEAFFADE